MLCKIQTSVVLMRLADRHRIQENQNTSKFGTNFICIKSHKESKKNICKLLPGKRMYQKRYVVGHGFESRIFWRVWVNHGVH